MARVGVIGRGAILAEAAKRLANEGIDIPVVATCRPTPEDTVGIDDYEALASEFGAAFIVTQRINDPEVVAVLRGSELDCAASVNWVSYVRDEAIDACRGRVLNLHGGDLPRYRGNAPFGWAILGEEPSVGLTVHLMDPDELDAGPIVKKVHRTLTPTSTVGDLYDWMAEVGPSLLVDAVTGVLDGSAELLDQGATGLDPLRCFPRLPEDGRLHWSMSAHALGKIVRASGRPFAGAFADLDDDVLRIWDARPEPWEQKSLAVPGQVLSVDRQTGHVRVATGDGVLAIAEASIGHGAPTRPADLIRSTRTRLR